MEELSPASEVSQWFPIAPPSPSLPLTLPFQLFTMGQVATGQTNGGTLTFLDAGHGTGHRPIVAAAPVVSYAYAPHHVYYGKREAEPYTLAQVATGQTNGGVITSVGGVPVVPH